MEDEIASAGAIIGGSWGGSKSMTATSGPGISLMQENIGYAFISETPIVIVNVQRGSPSTGQPTMAAQADMMQARWGSHGDYEPIALSPSSVQEFFDFYISKTASGIVCFQFVQICIIRQISLKMFLPAESIQISEYGVAFQVSGVAD